MRRQLLSAFRKPPIILSVLLVALVLPFISLPEITRADYNNTRVDPWGTDEYSGSNWDSGHGVDVYSNGSSAWYDSGIDNCVTVPSGGGGLGCASGTVPSGIEWQCVELFNRFYLANGMITARWIGNGDSLVNNVPSGSGFTTESSTAATYVNAGDAITFTDGTSDGGHVVIVDSVSGSTVNVISQNTQGVKWTVNWNSSTHTLTQSYLTGYNVQDIIHAPDASHYHYHPFAADFNGDGLADIGLYDQNIGMFYIKHGPSFSDQITYQWASGSNYQPFVGDFNHDGYADIGLRDVNTGMIYIKHGPSFGDQVTYQWAAGANYQVLAADFNADGYADIGLRDMNTGTFYIKHGPGFSDQITYQWASGSNYVPLAADFNHDGYADIGLYDQYSGMFYIKHGTGFSDQLTYQWATGSNYQPFAADFNDDGYADIGLRDANIGMFYIKHGTSFSDQVTYQWAGG